MYVVEQKYYDSGKVATRILTEEELLKESVEPPEYNSCISKNNCDIYYDKFKTLQEAKKFELEARTA